MSINTDFSLTELKSLCCSASDMIARFAEREPVKFESLLKQIDSKVRRYGDYHTELSALIADKDEVTLAKLLRQYRVEKQVDLACRDILNQISIDKILHCVTELAMACLDVTYHYVYDSYVKRYGIPLSQTGQQQHLTIFGMGKLGGGELNFSSDIDLIMAYPEKGQTQGNAHGDKIIDNELFFHRLAQKLIHLLDRYDENGFVYRIDMRLKPFGSVGTLCITFDAMKRYYLQHGRNWERYALVKMRAVAGDTIAGDELVAALEDFIYQRQVDYEAVGSIEEMKTKIIANANEKKLSPMPMKKPCVITLNWARVGFVKLNFWYKRFR